MISELSNERQSRIVVMGDFNYRDIKWEHYVSTSPEGHGSHNFVESVRDAFLNQHVNFNTIREKQISIMLVSTNDELSVDKLQHFPPLGKSDHIMLAFIFDCKCNPK